MKYRRLPSEGRWTVDGSEAMRTAWTTVQQVRARRLGVRLVARHNSRERRGAELARYWMEGKEKKE